MNLSFISVSLQSPPPQLFLPFYEKKQNPQQKTLNCNHYRKYNIKYGIQMNTGDLNKALKELVNVITDQEIVQSDLNDEDEEIH